MKLKYVNQNPLNKRELDCVCRAISYATKTDYYTIMGQLYKTSLKLNCERLCVCCYENLIEKVYHCKLLKGFKGKKVKEITPIGTYLIRVKGHLTCVENGMIVDIFNCGNEIIDKVWFV